jgi:hypothetical protein
MHGAQTSKSCIEIETQGENRRRVKNQRSERKRDHFLEFLEKQKKFGKVLTK